MASSSSTPFTFREFSLAEIKRATNNFDQSLLIRRGWISEVYQGTYKDSNGTHTTVTIKVFQSGSESWNQGMTTWFEQELHIWPQYHHKHVVSVIGYCHELGENILVYEHMMNGSLAQHLSEKRIPCSFYLSWEECLHICIDVARGLEYLHNTIRYSDGSEFIRRDVALTNIMLDETGVAKISDLYSEYVPGLNEVPASNLDPEFHSSGIVTQSSDVYVFGVILVKVLSRKVSFDKEDMNLGAWFKKSIMDGTIHDRIIHPEMRAEISPECLTTLVSYIGECLNSESKKRSSFTQLVKKLELLMAPSFQRSCECYSLQEIQDATNNFQSNILGQGGEGTVYKGVTKSNRIVAVKCLKPEFSPGFEREIKMLTDLDHPNLVSLVGYCRDSDEKTLVYELMSNGNLHDNLYKAANPLSWMLCLNICIGAARGLRHLHARTNTSRKGIIHRDIKPVNILLDENFKAKISDFGLSKMGPQDQINSAIPTMVKGTVGYYAPEYLSSGEITRRVDVYAFGVVLCEVLCRKRHFQRDESFYPTEDEKYGQWAKENMDPFLKGLIAPICLEAFTLLMEKCLNVNPLRRPKMNEVVSMLEYALKWQEAWERQKYGADFCLPGGEDRVILYCQPKSFLSITVNVLVRAITGIAQLEVRDLGHDLCVMELEHALGNTADISIPQLFVKGKYYGDSTRILEQCGKGTLNTLFRLPPVQRTCDTCQKARTCGDCKTSQWFIQCENCGVIILTWSAYDDPPRSCLECNMNQLICSDIGIAFSF